MKKVLYTLLFSGLCLSAAAIPAKRVQTTLTQPDGTLITATFHGDEFMHFYVDVNGDRLQQDENGYWTVMSDAAIDAQNALWQQKKSARMAASTRSVQNGQYNEVPTIGKHSCLTLLVEFSDLKFSSIGTTERFDSLLNGNNYSFQEATGSVRQYFLDQSLNKYQPTFDVVGPITLDTTYSYYGANNGRGEDIRPQQMVSDAIKKAVEQNLIDDFSIYDGNNDGYVDLVYVFYAGYSEAENAGANYIWPHQWNLPSVLTYNGVAISRYACSSELMGKPTDSMICLDGIGSCSHEFGHCLGLPDFYNTGSNRGCYGMDRWSNMDMGCYNNNGKTPPAYTAFERYSLGWMDLTELPDSGLVTIKPILENNEGYVYYNPNNRDEFYTFENHQNTSWDTYCGGSNSVHGMLICHVDYDAYSWNANIVNNTPTHQRYTVAPADGTLYSYDLITTNNQYKLWESNFLADIWPGPTSASAFSKTTIPSATFFTNDSATFDISNITETADGNISFLIKPYNNSIFDGISSIQLDKSLYYNVYDATGRCIGRNKNSEAIHSLPTGLYIINSNNESQKIYIK